MIYVFLEISNKTMNPPLPILEILEIIEKKRPLFRISLILIIYIYIYICAARNPINTPPSTYGACMSILLIN